MQLVLELQVSEIVPAEALLGVLAALVSVCPFDACNREALIVIPPVFVAVAVPCA